MTYSEAINAILKLSSELGNEVREISSWTEVKTVILMERALDASIREVFCEG